MRFLVITADIAGCYNARVKVPFTALERLGVEWTFTPFIPDEPATNYNPKTKLYSLINLFRDYDIIMIQRTYVKPLVSLVVEACHVVGVPVIFETDDDYLSLIPNNPCYFALADQSLFNKFNDFKEQAQNLANQGKMGEANDLIAQANEMIPQLMLSRKQGEEDFKDILRMVDAVTVSTEELARTIRPYNKNVKVFENSVDRLFPVKHTISENDCVEMNEDGTFKKLNIPEKYYLTMLPRYGVLHRPDIPPQILKTPRIGYSCSGSHFPEDWNTIVDPLNNVAEKYPHCWWFFLGDRSLGNLFASTMNPKIRGRVYTNLALPHDLYMLNLSNCDINLAPLASSIFNMSKSDIKAVEAGSVRSCPIVPDYITYTRHWKDNDNCLVYKDARDFEEKLSLLIEKPNVRIELAENAFNYVRNNRMSWMQAEARYEFYKSLMNFPRLRSFKPNKELVK